MVLAKEDEKGGEDVEEWKKIVTLVVSSWAKVVLGSWEWMEPL